MFEENKKMLNEEITSVLKELRNTTPGTDEYGKVLSNLNGLYRLGLDQEKNDNSFKVDVSKIAAQMGTDEKRIKNETRDGLIKVCTDVGGLMLTLGVKFIMFRVGLHFEETGSIASPFVRNLISIDPTKN